MRKKCPFDAILFDLEGTLVDFQWRLKPAVTESLILLEDFGIDRSIFGLDTDYASLYNQTRGILKSRADDSEIKLFRQLDNLYEKYDADALTRWSPYTQTERTLKSLNSSGIRMGLVSNCGDNSVKKVLDKFSLTHYFETVISRDDVSYLKPAPEGLVKAAANLQLAPDQLLFVGDSSNDVMAARTASMQSCFLAGGESELTGESDVEAGYRIYNIDDLIELISGKDQAYGHRDTP